MGHNNRPNECLYKYEGQMARHDVVRSMEWVVLLAQLPAKRCFAAGILLLDRASDELHVQLLPELAEAPEEVAEVWRELQRDLVERSHEQGGSLVLDWLETTASNFIQLSGRNHVDTAMPKEALDLLYRTHVMSGREDQRQARKLELRRGAAP